MSPEEKNGAAVRSEFAFFFESIAELYNLRYGERPSSKAEEIKKAVQRMKNDGFFDDYLYENIETLFKLYPELYPAKLASSFKADAEQARKRLNDISKLVTMITGDLCGDIKELAAIGEESAKNNLLESLQR